MAAVTTGNWQKGLWPGVDDWFNDQYGSWEPEWSRIFKRKTSSKAFEQAVGMSLLGTVPIKGEGQAYEEDDTQQTYINNFVHDVRAMGTRITLEAYRYNQYNLDALQEKPRALADSFNETKERVAIAVLDNGFSSSYTMGASSDGVALFSSAHPVGPYGADQSNLLTAADLNETTLEDACITVDGMKDPRGLQKKYTPQMLVVPRNGRFLAGKILESDKTYDTANNAKNMLKGYLPGGYMVSHYVDDQDSWYITTNVNESAGFRLYQAWDLEFGMDNDFQTFDMLVKAFEAYSVGWVDFRCAVGNQGA